MSFASASRVRREIAPPSRECTRERHPGGGARGLPKVTPIKKSIHAPSAKSARPYPRPFHNDAGDQRTDEQLMGAYRGGDDAAFELLVRRYQRELFHFLTRFLGNRAAAEDIFQETFLQVHQSVHMFELHRQFRPWLFTIAANKARDYMRARKRRPASPLHAAITPGEESSGQYIDLMEAVVEQPAAFLEKRELRERVRRTVMGMPEHLREILLLSYFHQFPYKQISEILGVPLGTVKSRLHSAVAHFAQRWKKLNQNDRES